MAKYVWQEIDERMFQDEANLRERMFAFAKQYVKGRGALGTPECFPRISELARRYRRRQQEIADMIESMRDDGFPVDLIVGYQVNGCVGLYERVGDYRMEVFDEPESK